MKTYEKIEIVRNEFIQPDRLKTIFLVVLCSLVVGSIPIVFSISTPETEDIVPTEAALWQLE
ncbi:hypothetical protein IQ238_16430 [Pleurocapsales cyanobacterium LEGE 06147]|nr:hypothetical protein [Pleurocapsales cyanobacterium LEGE 06147]